MLPLFPITRGLIVKRRKYSLLFSTIQVMHFLLMNRKSLFLLNQLFKFLVLSLYI